MAPPVPTRLTPWCGAYQSDLATLLNIERAELPPAVEHLETKVGRIWIRTALDPPSSLRQAAAGLREWLDRDLNNSDRLRRQLSRSTGDEDPLVVVLVEGSAPVCDVLNQMTRFDQVWVGYLRHKPGLGWITLCGPDAASTEQVSRSVDAEAVHTLPIATFAATYCGDGAVRLWRGNPAGSSAMGDRQTRREPGR
jgi:hypothetical protein